MHRYVCRVPATLDIRSLWISGLHEGRHYFSFGNAVSVLYLAGARVEGGSECVLDRQMGTSCAASWRLGRVRPTDLLSGEPHTEHIYLKIILCFLGASKLNNNEALLGAIIALQCALLWVQQQRRTKLMVDVRPFWQVHCTTMSAKLCSIFSVP